MKQICRNCADYSAYYRRRASAFERLSLGKCEKRNEQRKQNETCESYICNAGKEKSIQEAAIKHLVYALTSIKQIAAILKEQQK